MVIGFLLTETECERNFARERNQHAGRPRLGMEGRRSGLKVMLDGLALDRLQCDGFPVGRFWHRVQDKYAQLFGTRILHTFKRREDKGKRRQKEDEGPDGKVY